MCLNVFIVTEGEKILKGVLVLHMFQYKCITMCPLLKILH